MPGRPRPGGPARSCRPPCVDSRPARTVAVTFQVGKYFPCAHNRSTTAEIRRTNVALPRTPCEEPAAGVDRLYGRGCSDGYVPPRVSSCPAQPDGPVAVV